MMMLFSIAMVHPSELTIAKWVNGTVITITDFAFASIKLAIAATCADGIRPPAIRFGDQQAAPVTPYPQTGRDRPGWVVAANRNVWLMIVRISTWREKLRVHA
jgi:hypothetical protein